MSADGTESSKSYYYREIQQFGLGQHWLQAVSATSELCLH
jgi:hypothetical protein